ncbi:MAG: bis(5'-nucleosyl)-tetraphosphatase [Candidatus Thermoplasmatota archaeon]
MTKEISAGAVIFNNNKYLLLKYSLGHWGFVKGKIEKNETPQQTFLREAEEETNIKKENLKIIKNFKEKINYYYKRKQETIYKEVIYFLAKSSTNEVTLSHEHIDYKWMEYAPAIEQLTFENTKNVLRKAHKLLKK